MANTAGLSPAFIAARGGHGGVIRQLQLAGADLNEGARKSDGWRPLHAAARHSDAGVEAILAAGAIVDLLLVDLEGRTAAAVAASRRST